MITITVVLPDRRKGQIQVEPSAYISEIKKAIVNDLNLGRPENFILAVATQSESTPIGNLKLRNGDLVFIIDVQMAKGSPAKIDPNAFQ